MRADAFVELVRRTAPRVETLMAEGLDRDSAEWVIRAFQIRDRDSRIGPFASPIEDLIVDYDCSTLQLASVGFRGKMTASQFGAAFAVCESGDPLVLLPTGAVALVDHEVRGAPPTHCAKDGGAFLDAFAAIVEFLAALRNGANLDVEATIVKCVEASGVFDSRAFYEQVLR